jgi:hypothetical protein
MPNIKSIRGFVSKIALTLLALVFLGTLLRSWVRGHGETLLQKLPAVQVPPPKQAATPASANPTQSVAPELPDLSDASKFISSIPDWANFRDAATALQLAGANAMTEAQAAAAVAEYIRTKYGTLLVAAKAACEQNLQGMPTTDIRGLTRLAPLLSMQARLLPQLAKADLAAGKTAEAIETLRASATLAKQTGEVGGILPWTLMCGARQAAMQVIQEQLPTWSKAQLTELHTTFQLTPDMQPQQVLQSMRDQTAAFIADPTLLEAQLLGTKQATTTGWGTALMDIVMPLSTERRRNVELQLYLADVDATIAGQPPTDAPTPSETWRQQSGWMADFLSLPNERINLRTYLRMINKITAEQTQMLANWEQAMK